ncbi:MAG: glycosyltransferase [Candidatus Diapherotrites archaeon]|nr:glycosyltransferase [Candidatus Diapherotrites archaeon]
MREKISVIVPTLNEEKFIEKTLLALKDQTMPKNEYEIIVSDSSSSDSTVEIAKSLADKVVVCERISAGYGRNFGAKHAKGSKLAFVDADTIVSPSYIEGVKEALDKGIAATGPMRAYKTDKLKHRIFYRAWSGLTRFTVMIQYPLVPGFSMAVKKSVFDDVDGFRKDKVTTEDYEFCMRIKKHGSFVFSNKMLVHTSARRFEEIGYLPYIANGINFLLFKKSWTWEKHRKDYSK